MANHPGTGSDNQASSEGGQAPSGVKEIPVGMSAADMTASNPEAVQEIQNAGKKAGAEDERKRVAELTVVFGKDPDFLAACVSKEGCTVIHAKAEKYDGLVAEVTALKADNDKLKLATKEPEIEFAASDDEGQSKPVGTESSVDAKDKVSVEHWNKHAKLREAYNGKKEVFQALYRHNPDEALACLKSK